MTEVGESGFEVALGNSDMFGTLMAQLTINESKTKSYDEGEGLQMSLPFRGSLLVEEGQDEACNEMESCSEVETNDEIEVPTSLSSTTVEGKDRFHPDLMKPLGAEGQEAMWIEDEVSTVASVYVKPAPSKRFSFLQSKKEEKIHVRKKKITKTVVLLSPKDDVAEETKVDASVHEEATVNIIKARALLNEALKAADESEEIAKNAFEHAATARRLMSKPEDEPDLEDILTVLKEKGEEAVARSKTSKGTISEYARKAFHYLDSILPSTTEKKAVDKSASMAEDTISTLGLQTDTFEYQMGAPSQVPSHLNSYHNMDLMSITSLNEILDGPNDEAIEKTLSPRQVLSEIHVPMNKTPRSGPVPFSKNDGAHVVGEESQPGTRKVKKWGILNKFRREGKVSDRECKAMTRGEQKLDVDAQPTSNVVEEPTLPSIEENEEEESLKEAVDGVPLQRIEKIACPGISAPDSPVLHDAEIRVSQSMVSDTRSKDSKVSRYHIVVEQQPSQDDVSDASSSSSSSSDSTGASSDPSNTLSSTSPENAYQLDTVKSDWDHSVNFRRNPRAPSMVTAEITSDDEDEAEEENNDHGNLASSTTTRPHGVDPESVFPTSCPIKVNQLGIRRSIEAELLKMHQKSIANLSGEDSTESPFQDSTPFTVNQIGITVAAEAELLKMHQKSIANLSGEESTETTSKDDSLAIHTPSSRHGASVGTHRTRVTNDIRSTQGNAGIETVVESVCPSEPKPEEPDIQEPQASQALPSIRSAPSTASEVSNKSCLKVAKQTPNKSGGDSISSRTSSKSGRSTPSRTSNKSRHSTVHGTKFRSDPDGAKDDTTVANTIVNLRTTGQVSSRTKEKVASGDRSQPSHSVFEAPIAVLFRGADESTRGENDSLIDFVISPRRANIITPGGTKPYVMCRGEEPPKALIPVLPSISEKMTSETWQDVEENHPSLSVKRFAGIFGSRKGKQLKPNPNECLEKAHLIGPIHGQIGSQPTQDEEATELQRFNYSSTTDADDIEDSDDIMQLKKVLSDAVLKAEEANMEVMTAPFPHKRNRHRHRKGHGETRYVPNDLVEAIRMQSGREYKRSVTIERERIGDAPGISFSMDPEVDDAIDEQGPPRMDPSDDGGADVRVLAPTPRHRPRGEEDESSEKTESECCSQPAHPVCDDEEQEKYAQRHVTERLYGVIESTDSYIGNHTKVEVSKGVYIGDLLDKRNGEQQDIEQDKTELEHSEDVVDDKENEAIVLASPKVGVAPKRTRRSMFGLRRNVLSPEAKR